MIAQCSAGIAKDGLQVSQLWLLTMSCEMPGDIGTRHTLVRFWAYADNFDLICLGQQR